MGSRKLLIVALVACALASACSQYNTNLSIQTSSSALTFVSPATATVGSQGFTITANGTGFVPGAFILWNGTGLATTYVSSLQLTAPVPASLLTTAGSVQLAIDIPGSAVSGTANPNNGNVTTTTEVSNIVLFTIGAAPGTPPAITSIAVSGSAPPVAWTPYCSPNGFTLSVTGTNFTSDALVNWNGSERTTTFVSATQLAAAITPMDAAFPGTATVTVSNSVGASNSKPFTLSTPSTGLPTPGSVSVTPNTSPAGGAALTITVQGSNILPCTVVQWINANNVATTLATTYVPAVAASSTSPGNPVEVTAVVPVADLLGASTNQPACVLAFNVTPPAPIPVAQCASSSQAQSFTIVPPSITSLSSSTNATASTPSCSASGFSLTVNGTNFANSAVVNWNGLPRTTTFVSSTQLTALIPATDIALQNTSPGIPITVTGGLATSNALDFTVTAPSSLPTPTITSLSPSGTTAGTGTFTLIVNGSNILPCSVVEWVSGTPPVTTPLATAYLKPTAASVPQLSATVPGGPGGVIASVGTAQVEIANLSSVGSGVPFQIVAPTISSISPTSAPSCSLSGLTLTVNGTNFVNGLTVDWNGSPRLTTFVSPTQLSAAITQTDTAFLGTGAAAPAVTVSSESVASNSSRFSLTTPTPAPITPPATSPPPPTISSLSPSSAAVETATGPAVLLSVTGTNLFPCSAVYWNGAAAANALPATVFVGPAGITSLIPVTDLASAGTDQVTVSSPASLGGTSGSSGFTVFSSGSPISSTAIGIGGALSLPLMSADQRYAVYVLASTDGVTEVPGTTQNIFVADTCQGAPSGCTPSNALVSVGLSSNPADGDSSSPSISTDGRYVAFLSKATNLVSGDTNAVADVFVRDTCANAPSGCTPSTQRVSVATGGTQANGGSTSATISATGRYITFLSTATNLGPLSSSAGGVFLRDTCAGAASGCTPSTQELTAQH